MYCIMGGEHLFVTQTQEVDNKKVIFLECMKCGKTEIIKITKKY